VSTLALGIGACTAIFSVVDAVLLRPLPYPESERLVVIEETLLPQLSELPASPAHYLGWRRHATSFESLAAMHEGSYNLIRDGEPLRVSAWRTTANTFATLGTRPAIGRDFTPEEDRAGGARVVILDHGFWVRAFGGRPGILQGTLTLDGQPFTIVGVMPKGFALAGPADLYTPAAYGPSGVHDIQVIGRLKPGLTIEAARAELSRITRRLTEEEPGPRRSWGVKVEPMLESRVQGVHAVLLSLLGAVGLLMLIACANVASLLLARATSRGKELAVRAALGASRGRVVFELLGESLLLAIPGALLGVLAAHQGLEALVALVPDDLPRAAEIAIERRALVFACALAVATALASGLASALGATRRQLESALAESGRGQGEGPRPQRLRGALVAAEVALAVVLLAGAGLSIRSFDRLQHVPPGFEPRGALAITLSLPATRYPTGAEQARFAEEAVGRLSAVPGVEAAAASQGLPFAGRFDTFLLEVLGRADQPRAAISGLLVTPAYFHALRIPLLRGRRFDLRDGGDAPRVTIVSETTARRHFAGQDPLGQHIRAAGSPHWFEIVGVVGDVRHDRLDGAPVAQAYAPLPQGPADWSALTLVVRTAGADPGLAAGLRRAIQAVDRGQAVTSLRPISDWIAGSLARRRFSMLVLTIFSGVALVLAAVGVYGVTVYDVSRRSGELGIRRALGARPGQLVALVLRQGAGRVALGLIVGLAGALLLGRLLGSQVFGVSPHDPVTFGASSALLVIVSAVASLAPALRAARAEPMNALRNE
jgi:putative ABC transport system permease protein